VSGPAAAAASQPLLVTSLALNPNGQHATPNNTQHTTQEDYAETLAFLHMVNALLATLGPHGLPAGGIAVSHYTSFVLQHVVGQLWQRGYRCGSWVCGCQQAVCPGLETRCARHV
jgi:hypothetical protein